MRLCTESLVQWLLRTRQPGPCNPAWVLAVQLPDGKNNTAPTTAANPSATTFVLHTMHICRHGCTLH
jgi:hypothetical protein